MVFNPLNPLGVFTEPLERQLNPPEPKPACPECDSFDDVVKTLEEALSAKMDEYGLEYSNGKGYPTEHIRELALEVIEWPPMCSEHAKEVEPCL